MSGICSTTGVDGCFSNACLKEVVGDVRSVANTRHAKDAGTVYSTSYVNSVSSVRPELNVSLAKNVDVSSLSYQNSNLR
jgi:hypothetical protein